MNPMNIAEKILARASGSDLVQPGEFVIVEPAAAVLLDPTFWPGNWREVQKLADASKVIVVLDHLAPASEVNAARAHSTARAFVKRFGIERFHDVGREQGISHVVTADNVYALPGTVLVNQDSHACSAGAFNCAARGVGLQDMLYVVTKGKAWFRVGETVRYDLEGRLRAGVYAKDVFLHMAGTFGAHVNENVEFGGSGMSSLNLNARLTLATMGAELSAEFVIFEPDDALIEYVRTRNPAPFTPTWPDENARYKARRTIDLSVLEPLVALPDAVVNNSVPVSSVAGERIDQAFIGSCANGTLDDIAVAAQIVAGKRVAAGTRLIVTPGSQAIFRDALRAGYVDTLMEAGAVVTPSTCGACIGGHMGVLGPNETCITASTRNFKGRMGDMTARIFMASSATVAASALTGHITDPTAFLEGAAA